MQSLFVRLMMCMDRCTLLPSFSPPTAIWNRRLLLFSFSVLFLSSSYLSFHSFASCASLCSCCRKEKKSNLGSYPRLLNGSAEYSKYYSRKPRYQILSYKKKEEMNSRVSSCKYVLTHFSLASYKGDIGKQCRPR